MAVLLLHKSRNALFDTPSSLAIIFVMRTKESASQKLFTDNAFTLDHWTTELLSKCISCSFQKKMTVKVLPTIPYQVTLPQSRTIVSIIFRHYMVPFKEKGELHVQYLYNKYST